MSDEKEEPKKPEPDPKLAPEFPWRAIAFDPGFFQAEPVDNTAEQQT